MKRAGVLDAEIYLLGTRWVMILGGNEKFSLETKAKADRGHPKVQEWEELMWRFQKALPLAKPGEKWLLMERIFKLEG
jgi:L-rhamnose mutarotase